MKRAMVLTAMVAAGLGLGTMAALRGQETAPAGGEEKPAAAPAQKLVQRTYDIRDLLSHGANYTHVNSFLPVTEINETFARQPGGGAAGLDGGEGSEPLTPKAPLKQTLMWVVEPDSWKSMAPDIGEAPDPKFIGGRLIITQTPHNHQKIAELLEELRGKAERQLVIQGWWVQADEKELAALMAAGKGTDPRQVSAEALKAAKVLYRGRIVCYDEQQTFVASGREYSAVLAMELTGEEKVSVIPSVRIVHAGLILETQAQLNPDGKTAHVGLWGSVGRLRGPMVPVDRKTLSQIDADAQCFRTALTVPLGVPILTGGGSFGEEGKGMYLVVQVDRVGK